MLTPQAQYLYERLLNQEELNDFVLIGGSALALRIGHRISEDLDFNFLKPHLPKAQIDQLIRKLNDLTFTWITSQSIENECFSMGEDVEEYHQDYLVSSQTEPLPPVEMQMALEHSQTADFDSARFLLKPQRTYKKAVSAFEPYSTIKDPYLEARGALGRLVKHDEDHGRTRKKYVYVNNRLEGCAPRTILEVLKSVCSPITLN